MPSVVLTKEIGYRPQYLITQPWEEKHIEAVTRLFYTHELGYWFIKFKTEDRHGRPGLVKEPRMLAIAHSEEEAKTKIYEIAVGIAKRYIGNDPNITLENRCEPKPAEASK